MATPIRFYEARDRGASAEAYRRGREAALKAAGVIPVNPFLPGTIFHQAFTRAVNDASLEKNPSSDAEP